MKILITYHNCLRDYRGVLLLAEVLRHQGHTVLIRAHWRQQIEYAKAYNVDLILVGQIAESSTYDVAEFAKQNKILLAIHASETAVTKDSYHCLFIYNNNLMNDEMIDFQNIVSKDIYEYLQGEQKINQKQKYHLLGMPRFDLSVNENLRNVETKTFETKYGTTNYKKVYLFISAFLFESTFDGYTEEDAKAMGLHDHVNRQKIKLEKFKVFFSKFQQYIKAENSLLLIKRHPWDCSDYFESNYGGLDNVRIIDRAEYITPCIAASDIVIHEYSSTAIEAWLYNKPTYSLSFADDVLSSEYNHLQHEMVVENFEQLKELLEGETHLKERINKSLELFQPYVDGLATIRYANGINALKPREKKRFKIPLKSRLKIFIKDVLEQRGLYKLSTENIPVFSKSWDFINWENDKARVRKLYRKPFRRYIKANKHLIQVK